MINAELTIDDEMFNAGTLDNPSRSIAGRRVVTLNTTMELVDAEVNMVALIAVIHGETHGGRAVGEDAVTLRRIADAIGGEACNDEQKPEPRARRRGTGVRDLDVG